MAANFAVLLTHVPGGWGVMEFVLLSVLPGLDAIGAVIAFRAIYYLVPLALGTLLFATVEGPAALKALVSRRASRLARPRAAPPAPERRDDKALTRSM